MNFFIKKIIIYLAKKIIKVLQKDTYEDYRKKYQIDDSFIFNGSGIQFNGDGVIVCGKKSYIGIGSTISSNKGYHVIIGSNCAISHNVRFYNNTYKSDHDFNIFPRPIKYGSIEVGDGVWVGANVLILPGVKIGENSVVGANSVVVNDIPPFAVASGIPCKVIRYKKIDGTSETSC